MRTKCNISQYLCVSHNQAVSRHIIIIGDFSMVNRFQEIYENNDWGYGSGLGSLEVNTRGYRAFLQHFISEKKITTVIDMGCGDWQFSKLIDWGGVNYQGYDVAPMVVSKNNVEFSKENVSFTLYSGNTAELPAADLLIVKDVLQHLPNQMVLDFLPILKQYKYVILTNCTNPKNANDVNNDIKLGDFRYIDLRIPPFSLDATLVYTMDVNGWKSKIKTMVLGYPSWRKLVLLVDNSINKVRS